MRARKPPGQRRLDTAVLRFYIRSMTTPLTSHLADPLPDGATQLFADDIRFSSPFADYQGRATVARLFTHIPHVFDELQVRRELAGEREIATVLHGRIADEPADAILDERYDEDGRIQELTLMLRPYAAVKLAMRRMHDALEA
jgi:hypothetical protein